MDPDQIAERLRNLPPQKQQEVFDFVEFLRARYGSERPLRPLRGLWKDLDVDVSPEDIDDARREMWGCLPRDDI